MTAPVHPLFAGIMDDFQRGQAAAAKASEAAEREARDPIDRIVSRVFDELAPDGKPIKDETE